MVETSIRQQANTEVRLAPFALVRVAALPYRRLSALTPPRTNHLIGEVRGARAEMERLRPQLEGALHAAIPAVGDLKLRGAAVELRRDVHNGRAPVLKHGRLPEIQALLAEADRHALGDWLAAAGHAAERSAEAESVLADEVRSHIRPALRQLAQEDMFNRPIALSTPELYLQIEREAIKPPRGLTAASSDRSILGYALRAAAKTSPFSTFMHVAPVPIDLLSPAPLPRFEAAIPMASVQLNRGIAARLYRASLDLAADRDQLRVQVNTTMRPAGVEGIEALVSEHIMLNGRPWRQDRIARFRFHPLLATMLIEHAGAQYTWADLRTLLTGAGLTTDRAEMLLIKLLERGLIWASAITDAFDPSPETRLLRSLEHVPEGRAAHAAVAALVGHAAEFPSAAGCARVELIRRIRDLEQQAHAGVGIREAANCRNAILEDGWLYGAEGALGAPTAGLLEDLGRAIRPMVTHSPAYLKVRDAFVRRFGPGGGCDNLVSFLMDVVQDMAGDAGVPMSAVPAGDWQERVSTPASSRRERAGVTAFVQIAPLDAADVDRDGALVVVNRVYEGVGWLSARYTAGDQPGRDALRDHLRIWLREAMRPCEPIGLILSGECNNLQAHTRLTDRVLAWPGEPLRAGTPGVLPAHRVGLRHNEATDLLEFIDRQGKRFMPVYLGSILPVPTWGPSYWLFTLTQPYRIAWPKPSPSLDGSSDVVFEPRVMQGRIVLSRSTWWVRSRWLRDCWFAEGGARRLMRVASTCQGEGVPSVFFAQPFACDKGGWTSIPVEAMKPLWVDIGNPFLLDMLERMCGQAEWIAIREMLPGNSDLWLQRGGERHVSELQVEMMV